MSYYYFLVEYGNGEEDIFVGKNREELETVRNDQDLESDESKKVYQIKEVEGDYIEIPRSGGIYGFDY